MTTHGASGSRVSGIRTALRILNVRLRFILLMLLTGLIAAKWDSLAAHWERWTSPETREAATAEMVEYYCPMHPSVIRPAPGSCPICGMPLSRRVKGEAVELPEGVLGRVSLAPARMHLAGVGVSEVAPRTLHREIRAFGAVEVEERRIEHVSARVAGRIERILVDYPDGEVAAGEPLLELYSPDFLATEEEYLAALREGDSSAVAGPVADAARERLRLWGISDSDLSALASAGRANPRVVVHSPIRGTIIRRHVDHGEYVAEGAELYEIADLSRLWVTASVPESQADGVRLGMPVEVTATTFPGKEFPGEVDFIEPIFDSESRSLRVRARIANPGGTLRPGMYAEMRIQTGGGAGTYAMRAPAQGETYECPMKCDGLSFTAPGSCPVCGMDLVKVTGLPDGEELAVPESAVIDTGARKVVYLEREPGVFDAVEVALGQLVDGFYPVMSGLSAGDRVVTAGTFLVDAELRLSPGAAASYFGASGGH